MTNVQIAAAFDHVADLLEYQGDNVFRVRAYRNAARTIGSLVESLASVRGGSGCGLTDLDGIGADLASKIESLLDTGQLPLLDELHKQVPAAVFELMRVPGLGPKKVKLLVDELGIDSLEALELACREGRVEKVKGFGVKTQAAILENVGFAKDPAHSRILWNEADGIARELIDWMRRCPQARQVEGAGSWRRGRETVGDLDLVIDSDDATAVMDHLERWPEKTAVLQRGDTKTSIRGPREMQIDLRVVTGESFGAALLYFTGSKEHNVRLRSRARDRGLTINEYGVQRLDAVAAEGRPARGSCVAGHSEADVYEAEGLPAIDRGLSYIAITDHGQRVTMAHGLDRTRLLRQWDEIDRLNESLAADGPPPITVLKGIEVDMLEKGGLDLPDEVLARADWVVASLHYGQNQPRDRITARITEAIENPHVHVIGHPTGRLINRRPPYDVDIEAVIEVAARTGTFLEINANPWRLDLDDKHAAAAKRAGVKLVISTDAHSTRGLDVMRCGILQARRGGLRAADVANTRTLAGLRKLIGR